MLAACCCQTKGCSVVTDEEKRELVLRWCREGGSRLQRHLVEYEAGVPPGSLLDWGLDMGLICRRRNRWMKKESSNDQGNN